MTTSGKALEPGPRTHSVTHSVVHQCTKNMNSGTFSSVAVIRLISNEAFEEVHTIRRTVAVKCLHTPMHKNMYITAVFSCSDFYSSSVFVME